jgi:DNA-binding XRE family transcriptional regulator
MDGYDLKRLRDELGLTQAEAFQAAGVSSATIRSAIERNRLPAYGPDSYKQLAKVFREYAQKKREEVIA